MGSWFGYRSMLVRNQGPSLDLPEILVRFSYKSLKKATQNFNTKMIGNGISSSYKGTLEDGSKVMVIVIETARQLEDITSIIKIMSGIKHRNVVEIIGYCIEGDHRIIVHEFVGDYTLDQLLFPGSGIEHATLDWLVRASICIGIARGLEYLHHGISPRVVHRDVKPKNIVLDGCFNPKIVDFGLACLLEDSEVDHSDTLVGTIGFFDPEYLSTGTFTEKADVYGFGVLLLEVISGRKVFSLVRLANDDDVPLKEWVRELSENGRVREVIDPTLVEYPENEVIRFINVALFCIQASSDHRPSMFEVWHMLSGSYDMSRKVLGRPWDSWSSSNDNEYNDPALGNFIDI